MIEDEVPGRDKTYAEEKGYPAVLSTGEEGQGEVYDVLAEDAVFGEVTDHGPNYRNVGWLGLVHINVLSILWL